MQARPPALCTEGTLMFDLVYITVGLTFFAGAWLLVKACEKL